MILFAFSFALAVFALFAVSNQAHAANGINNQINYQAKLLDSSGVPVSNGSYSVYFSIYDAASGGNRVWTATGTIASPLALTVNVQSGLFTVLLGDNTTSTGPQNALDNSINWNSNSLYLGVTIGVDAEMTPRKRLSSAPYAFNAERLQGMYASSSIFATSSLFVVNQASNTAATGTRTALEVRSSGTSSNYDFLFRGVNDLGATVFSINRVGSVTTTGNFVLGDGTSDLITVNGRFNTDLVPSTDLTYSLGTASLRWNGAFGHVTATTVTTTNLFASNLNVNHFTSLNVTTTNLFVSSTISNAYASGTDLSLVATVEVPADETVVDLVVADRHVYALGTGVLRVWDVTNPVAPTTTATSSVFGGESMAIEGRYLYVNSGSSGFQIFDITSPDAPFVVGSSTESFPNERTFVRGGYMYIGNSIYDVHDPRSIDLVATTINAVTFFTDGFLQGKVYFQVRSSGSSELQMWDVSDPYRPVVITSFGLAFTPDQITVQGGYAYIGVSGSDEIHVYDIGNLENVYEVASFTGNGEMQAAGRYLYTSGMQVFDIINPLSPTLVKVIPLIETPFAVSGRYAYVASSGITDYFHVVDLGGIETPALSTALAEIGYLQVRTDGRVGGNFTITGALNVGAGGIQVDGPFMVNASNTTSSVAGSIAFEMNATVGTSTYTDQLSSLFAMSGDDLFVAGNIGSVSSVYTNGAFIAGTGTTMFGDGFIRRTNGVLTISATGGLSLGGSVTSTAQFYGNMVTSTSLFANTAVLGGLVVSGTTVCLTTGVGCGAGAEADTLFTVTNRGAAATATLQLYGGFLASSSTVTSTFTVVGATSLQGLTFTNATGANLSLSGRVNSNLLPQTDLAYSLGSASLRWNAYLGNVTSTAVTTTNLFAGTVSSTNLYASTSSIVNLNTQNIYGVNATFTNLYFPGALVGSYVSGSTLTIRSTVTVPGNEEPTRLVVADRHAYVLNQAPDEGINSIRVWDVSDPGAPTTSVTTTAIGLEDLVVDGRYLYVDGGANGLRVYDVTSPDRPTTVGTYPDSVGTRIHVYGGYAYLKGGIYDVHNPRLPRLVSTLTGILGSIVDTYLQGKVYFVLESSGSPSIKAFDVSDPSRPVLISETAFPGFSPSHIVVQGGYAYITDGSSIRVFDIGDLGAVYQVGSLNGFTSISQIKVIGRYVFMLDSSVFKIIDVLDPDSPGVVATNDTGFTSFDVSGRYVYLVNGGITDTFSVIDLGGVDISNLMAGAAELGALQVRTDGRVARNLDVGGSLSVGPGGLFVDGPFMVNASNTTSSVAGAIAFEQNALVGTSTYTDQLHSLFGMSGDDLFVAGNIGSVSSVYTNGAFIAGTGTTMLGDGFIRRTNGVLTISASGGVSINGSVTSTGIFSGGTVTSTNLFANMATLGGLVVSGTTVCLSSGTGCAAAGGTDLNWTYTGASNGFVYNATATTDILLGSTATTTGAPVYFDLSGATHGTSSVYFGFSTNTNIYIGTTTHIGLHSLFSLSGNDLVVGGNIGSASSIYTNGAFIAGTGTTMFGSGFISNNSATLTISSVSSVSFLTSIEQVISSSTAFTTMSSSALTPDVVRSISVVGDYAYVLASTTFQVVDIRDPRNAIKVRSYYHGATDALRLKVYGNMAIYDRPESGSVVSLDITNPAEPIEGRWGLSTGNLPVVSRVSGGELINWVRTGIGDTTASRIRLYSLADTVLIAQSVTVPQVNPAALDVQGRMAYAVDVNLAQTSSSLNIFKMDLSAPNAFALVTSTLISSAASGTHIEVSGRSAYVFDSTGLLRVYDISSTATLPLLTTLTTGFNTVRDMKIRGKYLYVGGIESGVQRIKIYDTSSSTAPFLVKSFNQNNSYFDIIGRYLYVVEDTGNTLQIIDLGGIEVSSLVTPLANIGDLRVGRDAQINRTLSIGSGLTVGGSIKAGGKIAADAGFVSTASDTVALVHFENENTQTNSGTNWAAFINRLTVGTGGTATTGTQHYNMVLTYASTSRSGFCIDDTQTASTCPSQVGYSLVADGPIGASGFDLAERYASTGTVEATDLVSLASSASATVMRTSGIPYDPKLIGIISSAPGFTLGIYDGEQVALTGRVPTKVSTINGAIRIGDPLTSSIYPGVAMKATKAGMIVGYALDDADTTSTIEVFVNVGYNAGSILATDGTISEVRDNLVFAASAIASSTAPTADSLGLTFRGSAWNVSTSQLSAPSFTLLTDVQSATSSVFAFRNASGTNVASLTEQGDLSIAGRLFLSARGTPQDQFYMYLDDSLAPTSTYIATNANGFQANSSYDLAERYYSPDNLEPGDLVMIRPEGQIHVQRTSGEEHVVIGIVSTQPGFVLGAHSTSSYPIALAGRVPTKVSTMNGAIKAGDAVGPSSIPGVAVKATSGGPIVGYALEAYDASEVGKVEVFLSAQAALASSEQDAPQPAVLGASTSDAPPGGFAVIQSGATRVHISYASIGAYPKVFVTPATEAGNWWTENYTDVGFDIVLAATLPRDVMFGWEVRPLMAGSQIFSSNNTYQALDPMTGQVIQAEAEETDGAPLEEEEEPDDETAVEDTGSGSSTEPTT